jgi:hypothetical protein
MSSHEEPRVEDDGDVRPAAEAPSAMPIADEKMTGGTSEPSKAHQGVIHGARLAAEKEQKMSLIQGIKLYPKAVAWSMIISTCIVMEGFDIALVNNFCELCHCWSWLSLAF